MNPLRSLLVQFSRIPVGVLLILIIVISATITLGVTGIISQSEKAYEARRVNPQQETNTKAVKENLP